MGKGGVGCTGIWFINILLFLCLYVGIAYTGGTAENKTRGDPGPVTRLILSCDWGEGTSEQSDFGSSIILSKKNKINCFVFELFY